MIKENRALRLIVTLCMTVIIAVSLCIPCFAAEDKGWMADRDDISATGELIIPNGVKAVSPHVLDRVYSRTVEVVKVPNSVKVIETGSLYKAYGLKRVEIDNYEGGVVIEEDAILATAEIVYLREKPTNPPTTNTTRKVPSYVGDTQSATNAPTTTKAPATTKAAAPKKSVTTTKAAETTTEKVETTAEKKNTVAVTENTPFSDAKSQLEDVEVWDKLINQTTEQATAPQQKTNGFAKGASYAAVAVVAVSAIGLGVLKFKK